MLHKHSKGSSATRARACSAITSASAACHVHDVAAIAEHAHVFLVLRAPVHPVHLLARRPGLHVVCMDAGCSS